MRPFALILSLALSTAVAGSAWGQSGDAPSKETIEEYCRKVRATTPTDPEGLFELGTWCREVSLTEQSEKAFRQVLNIDSDHEGARRELGFIRHGVGWVNPEERAERTKAESAQRDGDNPAPGASTDSGATEGSSNGAAPTSPASSSGGDPSQGDGGTTETTTGESTSTLR